MANIKPDTGYVPTPFFFCIRIFTTKVTKGKHKGHKALIVCEFFLCVLCGFLVASVVKI